MSAHELTEAGVDRLLAQYMGCRVRCVCGSLQSIRVDVGHVHRRCPSSVFRELAQDMVNLAQHQQSRPPSLGSLKCDHKFVGTGACAKCGWRP